MHLDKKYIQITKRRDFSQIAKVQEKYIPASNPALNVSRFMF